MYAEPTYEELLQKNIDLERRNNELEKFEASFQAADAGMALLNGEGRFLEVNAKLCSVLGYTREELLQKQPTDLHPSGLQAGFGQIPGLLKERKALPRETICLGKDGSAISLELQILVMQLNGETVIQLVARDLTSFNQRKELLHQYEQIFSLPTQDLMAFVDKNYIYQLVNESYGRAHNKRREEIVGHTVISLLGEKAFLQTIKPQIDRCLSGETVRYQAWFDFATIGRRYRDVTYHPCQLSGGRISGILVVSKDLTDLTIAKERQELERERLNNILQAIPDGVYIVNQEYMVEYVNPVIEKEFGVVGGKKCFQYLQNRTEPCVNCKNKKVFAGESVHGKWHSAANNKDYEVFDSPLKSQGGIFAKVSLLHDVTQEKKVKEALKKNQMLLAGIVNNSLAVIGVKDIHGKYLMVNTRFEALFKKSGQDIIGKTDLDLFPAKQARKLQENDQTVLDSMLVSQFEEIVQHEDGNHVYISNKFPLFDGDDSVYGIAAMATDITDYKQLELELQENNKRLTALINASPDTICFKDGEGRWMLTNEAALRMFQLAGVAYKGKTDVELATYSEFYREALLSCMETDEDAWENGELSRRDKKIATPDGKEKVFDVVKIPLFQADGARQGLVVQGHEITERLKTEKNLYQEIVARQQAAEVVQRKSEELEEANIALRVLLKQQKDVAAEVQQSVLAQLEKVVLPYISLLRQSMPDDKGKEYLDIITDHVHDVGSPFIKKLSNPSLGLTKKEILVADMVRQGRKTKEIAELLNLQPPSVETYRNRIRKKLNLNKKRITLYQYLNATFPST
jgi:PAS domain S-box-containing protein